MEKPYQYLDGYVFLHGKKSWLGVCGLWSDPDGKKVRYMGKLQPDDGDDPDRIIVFVDVDKSEDNATEKLRKKIDDVVAFANPSFSTGTSSQIGTSAPTRWSTKLPWGAFLRVTADKGERDSVFESLYPVKAGGQVPDDAYYGHALCDSDSWDVLLELGTEGTKADLDPLIQLVTSVRGVAGVVVNKHKNHKYKPDPPKPGACKEWTDDTNQSAV